MKFLIFFKLIRVDRVDPSWPMKPETRPHDRVNPRTGFDNYATTSLFSLSLILINFF